MKIKYLLTAIAIVAVTENSFAQYSQDVIRFSTGQTGSTSRIKALGNAGTAVGGDLSSVSGNPAGLGFFTKSELSITPEYNGSKVKSTYFGQTTTDNKNSANVNNAAFVIYSPISKPRGADKTKGWLSVNYGAAYNRTNNFYENIHYTGSNPNNNINNYYAGQANSFGVNGGLAGWAYGQNLIDLYGAANPTYQSNTVGGVNQESFTSRTGGQSAVDFSLGANYSNKFYIGLGVSFTNLRYNSSSTFYEDGTASILETGGAINRAYSSAYSQDQVTRGTGFAARLGLIYKPVEALRLGATLTSPTFYNVDDTYSEGLATNITNNGSYSDGPANYTLNYNFRTPLKVAGGAALFIKQFGFITGDVEYVDYSTAHISSNADFNGNGDNAEIKSLYKSAVNVHAGAEARLSSMFLLRGGYGVQGDFRKNNGSDIKTASAGIGLRFGAYYVDATYTHVTGNQTIFPYEIGANSPSVLLNRSNNNGYLTLGYRF